MYRTVTTILILGTLGVAASCSLFLDVDALQEGTGQAGAGVDAGGDASAGMGGTAGAAGQGGAGGDAGPDEVPLGELAAALAAAACTNMNGCMGPLAELIYHEDDCEALLTATMADTIVAAIARSQDGGAVTYDPAKAAECVRALAEGALEDPPVCTDLQKGLDDCRAALGDLGGPGDSCTHYYECQAGHYCDIEQSCPGVCQPYRAAGQDCTAAAQCGVGLTCVDNTADGGVLTAGKCEAYTPTQGACGLGKAPCSLGDYCVENKCLPLSDAFVIKAGFACYGNGLLCEAGLACQFKGLPFLSNGECVPPIDATEACAVGVPESCGPGLYCTWGELNPKCVALPTANQACAKSTVQALGISSPCAAGLACVNDLCRPRAALGEACVGDAQCFSGLCAGADAGSGECTLPACL